MTENQFPGHSTGPEEQSPLDHRMSRRHLLRLAGSAGLTGKELRT